MLYSQLTKRMIIPAVMAVITFTIGEAPARASTSPNDPYFSKQLHLPQIKAVEAWGIVNSNTAIKIAVLDSGVDSSHPDLKDNLLPTINLVQGESASDLNGHGTNVIGVLGAKGNNALGVTGVLWNAKILPIKVLDKKGFSSSDRLAAGIKRAVTEGAKVVLMSASTLYYSKALEDAIDFAEGRGVVVVAASGNEGSRVNYPAAFPTVIAVGAVTNSNAIHSRSNFGPEINLVAPGVNVYTTARGGGYDSMKGTSAAAPQVAGAAALILARNPKMKPLEVRQLLYHSATKLHGARWDKRTGYGLLNVQKAVMSRLPDDINEPNNTQSTAAAFPMESQIRGSLSDKDKSDWFYTDIPYEGTLELKADVSVDTPAPLAASVYQDGKPQDTYYFGNKTTATIAVKPGKVHIHFQRSAISGTVHYTITNRFSIAPDRYEPNNSIDQVRPLPPGNNIEIKGNFHTAQDVDWYSYFVRDPGKLYLRVDTDTLRLDPQIRVRKERDKTSGGIFLDSSSATDPLESLEMNVTPGRYLFQIQNSYPAAVSGEYFFQLNYMPERKDPNEPNDTYRLATKLGDNSLITGTISSEADNDWFTFSIPKETYVTIRAPYVPPQVKIMMSIYDSRDMKYAIRAEKVSGQDNSIVFERKLAAGTYYLKLTSTTPFRYDAYRFTLTRQEMYGGFRDIHGHWARNDIGRLTQRGVITVPNTYSFRPDANMTRAEFADMLLRSMKAKKIPVGRVGTNTYKDLNKKHWAYESLLQASQLGIMNGFNGKIEPDRSVNRAEMALMIARAKKLNVSKSSSISYRDVPNSHWAVAAIETLSRYGWLHGYQDGTFKPERPVKRGEMVTVLAKSFQL
ncbi:S8 family peptidase [Brevibacillus laterosporus]|uniref:S8 family peptidase n=1 Tax=Brevibacillus laterosporus TaxID=1465 RepID=UPI000E6D2A5B|nr:S8 family serine peptidase [Brevibacillus laterosporus]AYB40782.1 serine protease [Brevibacillus laterosporus]MBM7107005.1 Thermophilic serine proteinase precursor [Brevibacillus laterosporus]MED4763183.1 S8 family serine peptidase [Brevibacillus laterosporus]NKQ20365.1 S8 family serine peptidase [Brevibacillus laterosporus]TPH19845.1 serine protease [Brevibacillus laterosporus]